MEFRLCVAADGNAPFDCWLNDWRDRTRIRS